MQLKYKANTKLFPKAKLMGRIKLGTFFALPEKDFSEYIKQVEEDETFKELLNKYRIVRYRKFPGIRPPPSHLKLKEELIAADNFDLAELIQRQPENWQTVRKVALKIGEERFSRFLRGEDGISFEEIFKECDLSHQEAERFKDFINSFHLQESFFTSSTSSNLSLRAHLCRVAWIQQQEGKLFILPLENSTYLVRGRYFIDYRRWENLIQDKRVPPDKTRKISSLFRKLDLINRRTTTLYQILYQIKEKQRNFLLSGDPRDMTPLTQREIARALKVNPSTVSRAIANKSILTPQGKEKALKEFFSGEKEKIKAFLLEILREEKEKLKEGAFSHPLSDDEISKKLKEAFGVEVARRTVTKYRKNLRIPSSKKRDLN